MRRRSFLQGMGCCAGIVAMGGTKLGNMVFAQGGPQRDIVVSIFLRGGMDALSFLVPHSDADYHTARPDLGLQGANILDLDGQFGFHKNATRLLELYNAQHLAPIVAAGSTDPTRSHFEAQDFMDRGAPGLPSYDGGGWLARYLQSVPAGSTFQGISMGSSISLQLDGHTKALALNGADGFTLEGGSLDDVRRGLRHMWAADPELSEVALQTLDATDTIDFANPGSYTPSPGVTYGSDDFAETLAALAQLIKLDVGLQAATVDTGGWDTHNGQADYNAPGNGYFANLITALSNGLHAFWTDLAAFHGRLTVVVMSEFGRRLRENDNRGTDHGHAGCMLVMSSNIVQKRVWGEWPGLGYDQLFEHVDVDVRTDFRRVLSEILYARLGYTQTFGIFPNFSYTTPLGIFGTAGNPPQAVNGFTIQG